MNKPWETVVAVADIENRRALAAILASFGLDAMCVSTAGQCRELIDKGEVKLVFSGQFFPDGDYHTILRACQACHEQPSVVLAAPRTSAIADQAIALGAFDVVSIPYRPTDVEWTFLKLRRSRQAAAAASSHAFASPRSIDTLSRRAS